MQTREEIRMDVWLSANRTFSFSSRSYYDSFGYLTLNEYRRMPAKWAV